MAAVRARLRFLSLFFLLNGLASSSPTSSGRNTPDQQEDLNYAVVSLTENARPDVTVPVRVTMPKYYKALWEDEKWTKPLGNYLGWSQRFGIEGLFLHPNTLDSEVMKSLFMGRGRNLDHVRSDPPEIRHAHKTVLCSKDGSPRGLQVCTRELAMFIDHIQPEKNGRVLWSPSEEHDPHNTGHYLHVELNSHVYGADYRVSEFRVEIDPRFHPVPFNTRPTMGPDSTRIPAYEWAVFGSRCNIWSELEVVLVCWGFRPKPTAGYSDKDIYYKHPKFLEKEQAEWAEDNCKQQ